MTIVDLYPYLILVGASIILATTWLLGQARRRARITRELVELNEKLKFDLPDFLRHCWQPLSKAGFVGISWHLDWFGTELNHSDGQEGETHIERKLEVEDITLELKLHDSKRRFEQRYFSTVVSESFFLLLYTDMWVKLGSVRGAFAQSAKLNVFLQHDMKNIVQLISLLAEQLEQTSAENEEKLIESLRTVMPTLQERSERFLGTLSRQEPGDDRTSVALTSAFRRAAEIHNLDVSIEGEAEVLINEQSFNSICDNLFGNYVDQERLNPGHNPVIDVAIQDRGAEVEISVRDRHGKPCHWPERLFEPFWSEKGEGLGIGLYHARQLVSGAGGSLIARTPSDKPLTFVVNLPKSV